MLSPKNHATFVAVILACFCGRALAVQPYPYASAPCLRGAGNCVPQRITYGYYPTTWRKWPEPEKKPGPEQIPTPAIKEQRPKVAPDATDQLPVEEEEPAPLMPTETEKEPTIPGTEGESPLLPPFEDSPPEPPKEPAGGPGPTDEAPKDAFGPEEGLPSAPKQIEDPMPDKPEAGSKIDLDDPFKDDPIEERPGRVDEPTRRGAAKSRRLEGAQQASAASLRGGWKSQTSALEVSADMPAAEAREPALLPVSTHREAAGPAPRLHNPLRTEAAIPREKKVVPTASWAADQTTSNNSAGAWRRNPLRTN